MNCQYYDNNFETCANGDCPFCADFCPVTENQEVCRYSDLDETEIARRESLDYEKQDSQEALRALAEENQALKNQLDEVTKERDAAIEDMKLIFSAGWSCFICAKENHCIKKDLVIGNCSDFLWRGKGE